MILVGAIAASALALPSSAAGQARTYGSPLTAEANLPMGCETQLSHANDGGQGTYAASPSNQPDCTWRQQGVFGVTDMNQDGRFSSAPATGRITNIAVKSGPNPGLIRFTIVRELLCPSSTCNVGGPGGEGGNPPGGSYCCYFVDEGPVVRPNPPGPGNPNGITNFPTNFLVVRNVDNNGVLAVDHIVLSGVSNTGSLPLHTTGRNNAFFYTSPGSVNASSWHPRMQPADQQAGRREQVGVAGIELLMQWTWCPAGQTCTTATPVPTGQPPPPDRVAPTFARPLRLVRNLFRVAPGATPVQIAQAARRPVPRGTTFTFSASEPGKLSIAIAKPAAGRRVGRRCVAPTRANRRRPRCTRYVTRATLRRPAGAGANRVAFTGRIGRRALASGRYRASATVKDVAGNTSRASSAFFTIVPG
jgi:hypothetical protein